MFEKGLSLIIPDVLSVNRNVPKEYFRNQSFVIDEFLLRKLTVNRGFSLTIRMINTDSEPGEICGGIRRERHLENQLERFLISL